MANQRDKRAGPSRRLREAALKFLYACEVSATSPQDLSEVYWELAQEHDIKRLGQARYSGLLQFEGQRMKWITSLRRHDAKILAVLRLYSEADGAREAWLKLRQTLEAITTDLGNLENALHEAGEERKRDTFKQQLPLVFASYRKLPRRIDDLEESVLAVAEARSALEPVRGTFQRIRKAAEIAAAIEVPGPADQDDAGVLALQKRETRMTAEQSAGQAQVEKIWSHHNAIDSLIASAATNYRLERIDMIDRCILRQAVWEMVHDPETPPLVAVNEAIELAKAFGSTESSAFVNGILDRILQEQKPSSESVENTPPAS